MVIKQGNDMPGYQKYNQPKIFSGYHEKRQFNEQNTTVNFSPA